MLRSEWKQNRPTTRAGWRGWGGCGGLIGTVPELLGQLEELPCFLCGNKEPAKTISNRWICCALGLAEDAAAYSVCWIELRAELCLCGFDPRQGCGLYGCGERVHSGAANEHPPFRYSWGKLQLQFQGARSSVSNKPVSL